MERQPAVDEVLPALNTDEASLDYTQGIRRQLVEVLVKKTDNLQDPKIIGTIGSLLDGMDRQALGKMKIRVEEQQNMNQEGMAANVAEILKQMGSKGHNFQAPEPVPREVPVLGSEVPDPVLIEGETATIATQQDYDTFHAQFAPVEGAN